MYMVFSERFVDNKPIRWFYGYYEDRNRANEVALHLNDVFKDHAEATFCVVPIESDDDIKAWGINGV